jgi:hypothetical protein
MTKEAVELAATVWSIYLMMHSSVNEHDQRRCSLERYVQKRASIMVMRSLPPGFLF